jgi:hypothetical protein
MTWTPDNSGTQALTVGVENVVDAPSTNATYEFAVDLSGLTNNADVVELRAYRSLLNGSTPLQVWKATYTGVQINAGLAAVNPIAQSPPLPMPYGGEFSIKQVGLFITGTLASGGTVITNVSGPASGGLANLSIAAAGILPSGTSITGVNANGLTVTLSTSATAAGTGSIYTIGNARSLAWEVSRV